MPSRKSGEEQLPVALSLSPASSRLSDSTSEMLRTRMGSLSRLGVLRGVGLLTMS
jgi:hypothetical protein